MAVNKSVACTIENAFNDPRSSSPHPPLLGQVALAGEHIVRPPVRRLSGHAELERCQRWTTSGTLDFAFLTCFLRDSTTAGSFSLRTSNSAATATFSDSSDEIFCILAGREPSSSSRPLRAEASAA